MLDVNKDGLHRAEWLNHCGLHRLGLPLGLSFNARSDIKAKSWLDPILLVKYCVGFLQVGLFIKS